MQAAPESKRRLEALRSLLDKGELSTQDELREKLEKMEFVVAQSTISRDLRKLGVIKAIDTNGRTVYRLRDPEADAPVVSTSLKDLVSEIASNGSIIVIHTAIGSASLVARHLDRVKPGGLLGTIAGDDTIFVAPASAKRIEATIEAIRDSLS
jgi:arginine repressor